MHNPANIACTGRHISPIFLCLPNHAIRSQFLAAFSRVAYEFIPNRFFYFVSRIETIKIDFPGDPHMHGDPATVGLVLFIVD